jgi:hypothetical protein
MEAVMNENRTLGLTVQIIERETDTQAEVELQLSPGEVLHGYGSARRNPRDTDIPQIGDQLATSRALSDLAHKLLEAAAAEISEMEHRRVRLTH